MTSNFPGEHTQADITPPPRLFEEFCPGLRRLIKYIQHQFEHVMSKCSMNPEKSPEKEYIFKTLEECMRFYSSYTGGTCRFRITIIENIVFRLIVIPIPVIENIQCVLEVKEESNDNEDYLYTIKSESIKNAITQFLREYCTSQLDGIDPSDWIKGLTETIPLNYKALQEFTFVSLYDRLLREIMEKFDFIKIRGDLQIDDEGLEEMLGSLELITSIIVDFHNGAKIAKCIKNKQKLDIIRLLIHSYFRITCILIERESDKTIIIKRIENLIRYFAILPVEIRIDDRIKELINEARKIQELYKSHDEIG